jgi:hypothetical protein
MFHPRCTLALIAVHTLGGAWYATRPGSPRLEAAQAEAKKAQDNPPEPSNRAFELAEALDRTIDYPGIDGAETKLAEELERMQVKYKLTFDLNETAFKAETGGNILEFLIAKPNPVPPMRVPLRTVIARVLRRVPVKSGATYLIRKDCIEITTDRAVRLEFGMPPAKEGERPLVLLTAEFSKRPLKGVLDRLADLSGTTVLLDPRAGNKGETAITARLLNVPVETAVKLVADMAGLDVVRKHNVFYATTADNAAKLRLEQEKDAPATGRGPDKRLMRFDKP